jgi:hypothetical protein
MAMSKANSENSRVSVHGSVLCWTARIATTALSLLAVLYVLCTRAEYASVLATIPSAVCVFVLSLAPSLMAWWSHRIGGAFVLVICLLYTEGAYDLADKAAFVHIVLPFSAVWASTAILHLVVSWKER